jgi:hypothetical protein
LNETFLFTAIGDIQGRWDAVTSAVSFVLAVALAWGLWRWGKRSGVLMILTISALALGAMAGINLIAVDKGVDPKPHRVNTAVQPVFHLSSTKENLFVVFLDRAVGAALPDVLEKDPQLKEGLKGFIFYPNTISFAHNTMLGSPALFGGYEYTADAMNARTHETDAKKINEALTLLPKIFGEAGYRVTFTDPSYANLVPNPPDLTPFENLKNVKAENIKGDNTTLLLKSLHLNQDQLPEHQRFEYDILERFSLYRIAPPWLRYRIYRNGEWWNANATDISFGVIMNSYANLAFLPQLTSVDSTGPTLNIMENETTHDTGAFGPDFQPTPWAIPVPPADLERFGDEESAQIVYNLGGSIKALEVWFQTLKSADLWDRTKIILVADHGVAFHSDKIREGGFTRFNPLLMVKEFGANAPFQVSDQFMTNADVPEILTRSLGGASNPWTGKPLSSDPKNGRLFVHVGPSWPPSMTATSFGIDQTWELTEKSIFTHDGWKEVK